MWIGIGVGFGCLVIILIIVLICGCIKKARKGNYSQMIVVDSPQVGIAQVQ